MTGFIQAAGLQPGLNPASAKPGQFKRGWLCRAGTYQVLQSKPTVKGIRPSQLSYHPSDLERLDFAGNGGMQSTVL